jgi:hypothetical protein
MERYQNRQDALNKIRTRSWNQSDGADARSGQPFDAAQGWKAKSDHIMQQLQGENVDPQAQAQAALGHRANARGANQLAGWRLCL